MNKVITAYADVDSMFDYRRALIQKYITQGMTGLPSHPTEDELAAFNERRRVEGDKLWELYIAKNYKERRMDTFEFPFFQFTSSKFKALFKERNLKDWAFGWYSTNFMSLFLTTIIDQEQLTEIPISIKGVVLYINTFPYEFDEPLKASLVDHCKTRFGGRVDVKVITSDVRNATVSFYKQYNYVFKYDLMLNEDYKPLFDSIGSPPIPETTFIVPDLLVREQEEFEGSPADLLFAGSLGIAPAFKIIPVSHSFYDYA